MTTKSEIEELEELRAKIKKMEKASKKAKKAKKKEEEDDFQGVWLRKGKNGKYAGSFVITPLGEKVWLCVFPNKFWTKKSNRPVYHVTLDKPKKKTEK